LNDAGGVGSQGELYFVPQKKASLKGPTASLGKEFVLPVFPRNQVLAPLGEDYIGVYEMRFRQMLNDVGEGGVLGYLFYNPDNQKFALVGTLAKIKKLERLEDGGIYVLLEGIGRFYIKDIVGEKPYIKCRVQAFNDYCDDIFVIKDKEQRLLEEIRYSVKLMKILYPQSNYTMSDAILRYRPSVELKDFRTVVLGDEASETVRQTKFSFAVMDMLKTDFVTKLLFLQEHVVERRYQHMLKVVEESTAFLEGELRKRGAISEMGIQELRQKSLEDISDLEVVTADSFKTANYANGEWTQRPVLME